MTRLTMTSMVDIFTTLLLFLLKNFVVDPQVVTPHRDVVLPLSRAETSPQESPVVVVGLRGILVADEQVAGPGATMSVVADGPRTIEPLRRRLGALRAQSADLRARRGESADTPFRLTVQGDQEIPFATLERVLYTAHMAGYAEISLATRRE